jgi:hypothetical protein
MSKRVASRNHLTAGHDPILAEQISASRPGMAHFAATGPLGATCKQCSYWQNATGKRRCAKYRQLTGHSGPPIAGILEACRYFERSDEE